MGTGWSGGDRSRSGARGRWSPGFWSQGTDDQPNHALTGLQSKQHSRQTNQAGTPKAILVHRAVRVAIRVFLEQQDAASNWVVQSQSASVNSSGAFYISQSAPEDADLGQPDTYRVRVRVLIRWTDNTLSLQEYTTRPYSFV